MSGQSTEDVKVELLQHFPDRIKNSIFFQDYLSIGSYLSDPAQYLGAVAQLEEGMENEFVGKFKGREEWQRKEFLEQKSLYGSDIALLSFKKFFPEFVQASLKKLLSTVLANNEQKNGFSIAADNPTPDIIVGIVSSAFNDLLKQRKPFKDVGAGHQHGEFSHRIQWYLITKMVEFSTNKLIKEPALIYEKLPGWSTERDNYPGLGRKSYMWEFLFDRDGVPSNAASIPFKTTAPEDFRAPSNVNRWLIEHGKTNYPFLSHSLKMRWDKRDSSNLLAYIERKQFNRRYAPNQDIPPEAMGESINFYNKVGIIKRS